MTDRYGGVILKPGDRNDCSDRDGVILEPGDRLRNGSSLVIAPTVDGNAWGEQASFSPRRGRSRLPRVHNKARWLVGDVQTNI